MAVITAPTMRAKTSPTVNRILSALRERILSGTYRDGEWLPAERALAEEFQVSRVLVRSAVEALDEEGLIARSARHRPLVRIARTKVSAEGRSETAAASRSIALWIWPQHNWPGSALTIRGIQESLGEQFRLVLGGVVGDSWEEIRASESRFLRQIQRDRDIEGLLLTYMGGAPHLPRLEELRALNLPMVFLDHRPPDGFEADYVGVNNKRAAERGVKHLLELGHRRIAHVSNFDTISTVAERLAGYRRALEAAGIPFDPALVEKDPGPPGTDTDIGCEALIGRLLSLPDPPTALFVVHDVAAYRVMAALRQRGVRVPDDISLVAFDGMERWMPIAPFLTTLYQPFDDIGAQAVDTLRERIESGATTPYRHTILDARLITNASTRPLFPK